MTNFDRWRHYMEGFESPDDYIDWGFYSLISMALQRKVWIGPKHSPLFPNMFIVYVGDPGVGKGLVLKQVKDFITYHKLPTPEQNREIFAKVMGDIDQAAAQVMAEHDYKLAKEQEGDSDKHSFEKPLLIPIGPESTTYEALVRTLSKSIRHINYIDFDEKLQKKKLGTYTHSSMSLVLEEMNSLFKKHAENVINFLLIAYDCGSYKYETKNQGIDRVRDCCINILAGTTPDNMQSSFDSSIIDNGFSSRCHFIFAYKNRKRQFQIPDLTVEQEQSKRELLEHIWKLAYLYGQVKVTPETYRWLEDWYQNSDKERSNTNVLLNPYYARKKVHIQKLAMAIHYGEGIDMEIGIPTFKKAIETSANAERNMHMALGLEKDNPLSKPANKIVKFITSAGARSRNELFVEFFDILPNGIDSLDLIIEYLLASSRIKEKTEEPTNGSSVVKIKYDVLRQL